MTRQMQLDETFRRVSPSIVAFTPKYVRTTAPVDFPPIIGTGFIVGDGLVVTNDHVARALAKVWKPPEAEAEEWAVRALALVDIPGEGFARVPLRVLGVFAIDEFKPNGSYYGPERPDIALVHVNARGLPALKVDASAIPLRPGVRVATAGYTMGTEALRAPGWIHQFCPTLQEGIVSAVLPFVCETPHALMINVMVQGGASGSPVFSPTRPAAAGVLYGSLVDSKFDRDGNHVYDMPTNFSYVVPGHMLQAAVKGALDCGIELPPDAPTLQDLLRTMPRKPAE